MKDVAPLRQDRIAVAAAFAAQGLMFAVLLTHLPQFETRYGIGDGTVTLVILIVSILAAAGSVAAESLAKRRGAPAALGAAILAVGVTSALIGCAPDLVVFLLGFVLYGPALGALDASSNMLAVRTQHAWGRSILTSFHATWSAAGIVGALLVSGSEHVNVPLTASIVVPAAAVVALGVVVSRRSWSIGGAVDPLAQPLNVPWRPVILIGVAMACFYVADAGTSNWSALYLHDVLRASDSVAALAYAAYQATSLVSRISGDFVVRRFDAVTTVVGGAVLGAAGLVLAITASGAIQAIAGFAVLGAGVTVVAPLCFSAAGALAPGGADAVIARVNIFNYVGAVVGGVAVGAVGETTSLRWGFLVPLAAVVALLSLARAFAPSPVVAAA